MGGIRNALAASLLSFVIGVSAAPVAVTVDDDASADFVAVSVFGNSTAGWAAPSPVPSPMPGAAVSGFGDSEGAVAISGFGDATTCGPVLPCAVAVSGTGDATCVEAFICLSVSALGNSTAYGRCIVLFAFFQFCGEGVAVAMRNSTANSVAISVTGESQGFVAASAAHPSVLCVAGGCLPCAFSTCVVVAVGDADSCPRGRDACLAASAVGNATACRDGDLQTNCLAVAPFGGASSCDSPRRSWHCVAASGTEESSSCQGSGEGFQCLALSATGETRSHYAVSGTGNASSEDNRISGTGVWIGGLAASGTGDASSCDARDECIALSGTGEARGRTAFSGKGLVESF